MAHYLPRDLICIRLRMSRKRSYSYVGPSRGPRVTSDAVLDVLNKARRGGQPLLAEFVPDDLATPEEMSADLADSDISSHELLCWTRRKKTVPPHFRLSKRTILFRRSELRKWLDERSQVKTLKVRVA